MTKIDEIMELLAAAKRKAEELGDGLLAYHIGTALLLAQENAAEHGVQPKGRQ